jgi:hypothetical protein
MLKGTVHKREHFDVFYFRGQKFTFFRDKKTSWKVANLYEYKTLQDNNCDAKR